MTAAQPIVERFQADLVDSDRATQQTVERMARHIRDAASDPVVQAIARNARRRFSKGQGCKDTAWAAWWWVKHYCKFVHDESLFNRHIRLIDGRSIFAPGSDELEMLVSPPVMVRMASPRGDCDDFTMLVCALLSVLGCSWEIITVAADPNEGDRFSHVYAVAVLEDGSRWPLDASHGHYPGWEVPAGHIIRYQAWDESGRPIDRPRPVVNRLHGYRRRRRGMGDCTANDSGGVTCTSASDTGSISNVDIGQSTGDYWNPTQVFTPSAGSANWGNILANSIGSGFQILGRVVAPTTTITGPGGYSLTTPGSLPAGVSASSLLPSSLGGSSSTLLLLALLFGGVLLFAGKK